MRQLSVHVRPDPRQVRTRNRTGTPVQRIDVSEDLIGFWANGFEYYLPAWDDVAGAGGYQQLTASGAPVETAPGLGRWGGKALQLDGASYLYRAEEDALLVRGSVTFAAWVYPTENSLFSPVVGKINTSAFDFRLGMWAGVAKWHFINYSNGALFEAVVPVPIPLNTWTLLVCDYDAETQTASLTANGGPVVRRPLLSYPYAPGAHYSAGGSFFVGTFASTFFKGRIQSLLRWDRLLTLAERGALMNENPLNMLGVLFTAAGGGSTPTPSWPASTVIPDPPSELTLTISGSNQCALAWLQNSANSLGIQIWRSVDGGTSEHLASVIAWQSDTYTDTDSDTSAHSYAYKIRAVNYAGASAFTAEAVSGAYVFSSSGNSQYLATI